ncbi:hypothetical protein RRG08_016444 [Elysia crispata]|uniref:Uncharacterized protein n=1 Tax=Elysia crispata TaxID=231223 RepID=A0AAE1CUE3_9GAST|nr:hypothetical protein RRG08_016444 [Elysia crispata]
MCANNVRGKLERSQGLIMVLERKDSKSSQIPKDPPTVVMWNQRHLRKLNLRFPDKLKVPQVRNSRPSHK